MAEWAVLVLVVPAVLIPVVLLIGFAGCYSVELKMQAPIIDSVVGVSLTSIEVAWTPRGPYQTFLIEVTTGGIAVFPLISAPASPFEVQGLETGVVYTFRVQTLIMMPDQESEFSEPVTGTTRLIAFDTVNDVGVPGDQPAAQGFCLVQRIQQTRLLASGTRAWITLRGASLEGAFIDRIFISQPAAAGDPYDAGPDLTPVVLTQTFLPANTELTLPPVDYTLDRTRALLIAFDLSPSPPSTARFIPVQPQDAVAFFQTTVEAALSDRQTGYATADRVYMVTRIEVS